MRIEERGYSMITDEQGREWLLQKLYNDGWRYVAVNDCNDIYITSEKPTVYDERRISVGSCKKWVGAYGFKTALPKLKKNEVLCIAEELGIVDWRNVNVDTPILVSFDGCNWFRKYFAKVQNGTIYAWNDGATSWSVANKEYCITAWRYVKLAEV